MDVAIVGATGSCGRQVAAQLIERSLLPETATLHLVGHKGGAHESELWGLRADLSDAFANQSPNIEVGTDIVGSDADVVVMMAGATVTRQTKDRAALAKINREIFSEVAESIGKMRRDVTVIVQSNPVELALSIFGQHVPRGQLIGAAAWSDSLRFERELASELGIHRPMVSAQCWGQHGDFMVPIWSRVRARGVTDERLADTIGSAREGRVLTDLPEEIAEIRTQMLSMINNGDVPGAFAFIQQHPPDLRAAVKPFFIHFSSATTKLATAHAVVDLLEFLAKGQTIVIPGQVVLDGEFGGLHGPLAVPVLLDQKGWSQVVELSIADDERTALEKSSRAVEAANRA
ncbi:MAG: hypothetical protein P8O03_08440 [Ilumatobacter sp.]|nr:hypothetical protein [Ilumatobacter sp.]MDG2039199.1 hypothetical protein [Ilumatobacter sp.]